MSPGTHAGWTDESLMAYVDGELDEVQREAFERAMGEDADLCARVDALKRQRDRVAAAFATVLDEPMPDRLSGLLGAEAAVAPATASVLSLDEARAARAAVRPARTGLPHWAAWGGMAASVLVGLLLGMQIQRGAGEDDIALGLRDGHFVAGGVVAHALSRQLAAESAPGAPVAVQLSFIDRQGAYCRTFSTAALAGLACQRDGRWAMQHLAAVEAMPSGAMRPAATALPRAVLEAVDQRIAGEALDPAGERDARDRGWRR